MSLFDEYRINGKLPSYSATCVECGLSRKNYKPQTNADRIRAMSDKDLAAYLANICYDLWKMFTKDPEKMWLDWLRQEASE